jgi:hypothetical protein
MAAMSTAEMQAFVEPRLGSWRTRVKRELRALSDRLRPDEELVGVAVALRRPLAGGGCLVAATDRRLLLVRSSSNCEEIAYDELISVTDDLAHGEVSLVTPGRVHTLTLASTPGATELVATLAHRIGEDRVHARAGGAEAWRIRAAFGTACVVVVVLLLRFGLGAVLDRGSADSRAPDPPSTGACLDIGAGTVDCDAPTAIFVVLGPRDMPSCPSSSATIVGAIAGTGAPRDELSRWCVDLIALRR